MQDFFHGYALNGIDAKGRVSVPAAYRDVIEARSKTRAILLAPHETQPCLVGFDTAYSARLNELIERRCADGAARDNAELVAFGLSERFSYDEPGRIVMTALLKEMFELDRWAFFIAKGETFEIWNPWRLIEVKGDAEPNIARTVQFCLKQKGEAA